MTTASELSADPRIVPVYHGAGGKPEPRPWDPGNTILIEPHPSMLKAREAILRHLDRTPEEGLGYGIFRRKTEVSKVRVDTFVACIWEIKDSGYTPGEEKLSKAGAPVRARYASSRNA